MNLVYGLALHEFCVAQLIERPPGVWRGGHRFDQRRIMQSFHDAFRRSILSNWFLTSSL